MKGLYRMIYEDPGGSILRLLALLCAGLGAREFPEFVSMLEVGGGPGIETYFAEGAPAGILAIFVVIGFGAWAVSMYYSLGYVSQLCGRLGARLTGAYPGPVTRILSWALTTVPFVITGWLITAMGFVDVGDWANGLTGAVATIVVLLLFFKFTPWGRKLWAKVRAQRDRRDSPQMVVATTCKHCGEELSEAIVNDDQAAVIDAYACLVDLYYQHLEDKHGDKTTVVEGAFAVKPA